ncbi:probable LRR receptor-like serine/threonine-protein kinase RKF3 [Eucalyptus grandis]|uniref:probable LRR receptor-like serine/threonine-protein kinase RKF3 n=1 Tax=Eucalyptus grandis TaxID=71139 RepID=UPI00192ECF9B|nr:probable LRR receptor-like serine/threonine-protein kinase RKF3 [Eucalyptus grandis]
MLIFLFIVLVLSSSLSSVDSSGHTDYEVSRRELEAADSSASPSCPLNFNYLSGLINGSSQRLLLLDVPTECGYMLQALRLVRSQYLHTTGHFFPPPNSSEACWDVYQSIVSSRIVGFNVQSTCGFKTSLMSETCANVTTRSDFERLLSGTELSDVQKFCNQSLDDESACTSCTDVLARVQGLYFGVPNNGNESDCNGYPFIYAAAYAEQFRPTDEGDLKCLFSLNFSADKKKKKKYGVVFWGIVTGCSNGFFGSVIVIWLCWTWHWRKKRMRKSLAQMESGNAGSGMEMNQMMTASARAIRFTLEEIKKATNNFSRDNMIGRGGYGNVYRGILTDGSEVALKRFKNCAAAGDRAFAHEVEVIASVRHVNLVELKGYCTETGPMEGHQRILVCEMVRSGSLFDHLFGQEQKPLSWPARRKIALGTARGLAYLHYGAQPIIIHRDVKASNILLDEAFDAKLADFGLAKFTPEGQSHVSTKVAGTLGYVAPEYALYGQLSERSDVYSFGVVLLELLSGKKAVISVENGEASLLADWAWSLVRGNSPLDVIDEGMPNLGAPEEMEKHVLLAVLCSHPVVYARPTMEHVMKILESDSPVPPIPDRPISIVAEIENVEQSASSGGSYSIMTSPSEFRPFMSEGYSLSSDTG